MASLADKTCVPCRRGTPPLKGNELDEIHHQLPEFAHWNVVDEHHLVRSYKFSDFKSALAFINLVGALAEEQGHHPDITLGWGKAEITTWTHAVDGLTESDFILPAKIDHLLNPERTPPATIAGKMTDRPQSLLPNHLAIAKQTWPNADMK